VQAVGVTSRQDGDVNGSRTDGGEAERAWRFARSLARIEPAVEEVLAEYATSYCGRPLRRRAVEQPSGLWVRWSIDGEPIVDLVDEGRGPVELVVREVALARPLRRRLRSRHVHVTYADSVEDWRPRQRRSTRSRA
jgi:hypothetical protein